MTDVVLVAGATGSLGRFIVEELRAARHDVRLIARRPDRAARLFPGISVHHGDALDPASLRGAFDGVSAVISAVGANTLPFPWRGWRSFDRLDVPAHENLLGEARRAGVKRFVYVGAYREESIASTPYVRAHDEVAAAVAASGLEWSVVRPTGLFSAFDVFLQMARSGTAFCIGDGRALSNPVHDRDVATACVEALQGESSVRDVGGPDVVTRDQMCTLAFEALGRRPRIVHPPARLIRWVGRLVRPMLPRVGDLLAFFSAIAEHDLVAPRVGTRTLSKYYVERVCAGT